MFYNYPQIQEFVIKNIVALQVMNLPELLQPASVIGSAIQDTEAVSVKSLVSEYFPLHSLSCGGQVCKLGKTILKIEKVPNYVVK